jgi:PAS domain S-box-containing protein
MLGECSSENRGRCPIPGLNRVILDSVADGVFTVDHEFRITSFNRAAEEITGMPRDEALGSLCCDVFRTTVCETACVLREAIATGRPIVNRAISIVRSDGQRVPIGVSASTLRDDDGSVIGGVETFRDLSLVEELRLELHKKTTFHHIVSRSPAMQEMFDILPEAARSGSTILVEGPSGSGKELVALAIHDLSPRRDGPFIPVNCGAIPETLLESELFGVVRGAFTGATRDRQGRFAAASGGTLFLDEIGELPKILQVRLLRVLEDGSYSPLGSSETLKADVRVVAATNRDLDQLLIENAFREDLFYRLAVVRFHLLPLKERLEDIPLLVDHFVPRLARIAGKDVAGISEDSLALFLAHEWPGNVRELKNALEHALVLCPGGIIRPEHLPASLRKSRVGQPASGGAAGFEEAEVRVIREALARHGSNRTAAARELGIHKTTLWRKMKKLGID